MSENNNWNNNNNKKKKIDFLLYGFVGCLIINLILFYYLLKPKPTPPTLLQQVENLYNVNQDTYNQIKSIKNTLDGNNIKK